MRDLAKTLMGLGITIGLSDRETFVKEVSAIIHEYQNDPAKADKWARAAISYLESVRDNINVQSAVKSVFADQPAPDKKDIEKLTATIEELTRELQKTRRK